MATNRCQCCFSLYPYPQPVKRRPTSNCISTPTPSLLLCLQHSFLDDRAMHIPHQPANIVGYQNQTRAPHLWETAPSAATLTLSLGWHMQLRGQPPKWPPHSFVHQGSCKKRQPWAPKALKKREANQPCVIYNIISSPASPLTASLLPFQPTSRTRVLPDAPFPGSALARKYFLSQLHPGTATIQKCTGTEGNYQTGFSAFISVGGLTKILIINHGCCMIRHNPGFKAFKADWAHSSTGEHAWQLGAGRPWCQLLVTPQLWGC